MSESQFDFGALKHALDETLVSLKHLQINPDRVNFVDGMELMSGGFGDVVCATIEDGDSEGHEKQLMAVKQLRPSGGRDQRLRIAVRLVREITVWAGLHHVNVLPFAGFYLDGTMTTAWLICPYESGGNVSQYLEKWKPGLDIRMKLALDTASGLAYLHGLDPAVCHADIKAANVLVREGTELTALLCDFGLASVIRDASTHSGLTTSRTIKGTIRYFSPELMDEDAVHTLKSDIWAWGCLLLEILMDTIPYEDSKNEQAVILDVVRGRLPVKLETHTLPESVKVLTTDCWQPDFESRPSAQKCEERLGASLEAYGDNAKSTIRPVDLEALMNMSLDLVPSYCKSDGDGWKAVFDPILFPNFRLDPLWSVHGTSYLCCTDFSVAGQEVAFGRSDGRLSVHDTNSEVLTFTLDLLDDEGRRVVVESVHFSPDGTEIATAGSDCIVRLRLPFIWAVATQAIRIRLKGHQPAVGSTNQSFSCLAFAWATHTCVSAAADFTLRLWNMKTGDHRVLATSEPRDGAPFEFLSVAISQKYVLAGCRSSFIMVWSCLTGALLTTLHGHEGAVYSLAFLPGKSEFVSGGRDRTIRHWDLDALVGEQSRGSANCLRVLSGHKGPISLLTVSPDGQRIASASYNYEVRIWDLKTGVTHLRINMLSNPLAMTFCNNSGTEGIHLATENALGRTTIWRVVVEDK